MQAELSSRLVTAGLLIVITALLLIGVHFFPIFRYLNLAIVFTLVGICAFEVASVASNNWRDYRKGLTFFVILAALPLGTLYGLSTQHIDNPLVLRHASLYYPFAAVWLVLILLLSLEIWPRRFDLKQGQSVTHELLPMLLLVGVGGSCFQVLTVSANSALLILWILLVVSLSDTSAYFFGKRWGSTKLAPAISPNKTVVGAVAALATAVIVGGTLRGLIGLDEQLFQAFIFAAIAGVLGQSGDLAKSYFKRIYGVKDFSELLPGHGGLLDRLDATLAVAPLVSFLLLAA